MKIPGNRYTPTKKLTQREAETLVKAMFKIQKLAYTPDRDPFTTYNLNNVAITLQKVIKASGRQYVLDEYFD